MCHFSKREDAPERRSDRGDLLELGEARSKESLHAWLPGFRSKY
jgi:hypothetical protein